MANLIVQNIISQIQNKCGKVEKIGDGYSLYKIASNDVYIYFRYSKIAKASKNVLRSFYGLRKEDISLLQGKKSFVCFVWDNEFSPILLPFNQFENYFYQSMPSSDGQYKVNIFFKSTGTELYFANIGKFNVDNFYGLNALWDIDQNKIAIPELSHSQIQSLIGAVGIKKGFNLWYPENDKLKMDKSIVDYSKIIKQLPHFNKEINNIISEIDVIWLKDNLPISYWEVEHSTPIYSGLLRFNDVLLSISGANNFNIVAEADRENKFGREINRPTFRQNNLIEKVTFIDYQNIYSWFYNLTGKIYGK